MKCGYIRQTWDCGNTREVEEKHTGRYGARGQKRQKRRKATPEEIAKVIQPQFAETDLDTITAIVTRYYEQDTWKSDLIFEQSSFDLLQNILKEAGELPAWTPYEDLVTTTFAAEASESAH